MKYFLYMNNDVVNSIISQYEQGIITEMISENEKGDNKSIERETKIGALARISTSFYKFLGAESELSAEKNNITSSENHKVSKEIVQKTLYDAAYNIAYENIDSNFNIKDFSGDLGEYIELTDDFQFVDFDSLQLLFTNDGLISFIKKSEAAEIEERINEEFNQQNRDTKRSYKSEIKQKSKELIEQNNKKYDDISEMIKIIKSVVPYTRMLISNKGFIIPLDDKYLRDEPETFGFKYGGGMTCVGYITNVIGKDCGPIDNTNIFFTLQHTINETLRQILPTSEENLYIINPIAIYYKNGENNEIN